ncbi:HD domain-containing protein [Cohaesibacter sp. CAU 1516]|uniref:HD domain-containing protein n=1 Tax=Cohaesibacter sp. CAU 1516 TaxID=2576038 RepID=UPI0010FF1C01|nr:HD domain-containing protein [Cohaesibacter sp. CAU 1516]TLP43329.1 HD domain-containing protein [Cohaesibacter sp. CAU 1516]
MLVDAELSDYVLRSDDRSDLFDPLARELLETEAVRRLKKIGFLGAIDYCKKWSGKEADRRRHNRLEHSVGVALLAQKFALTAEIPQHDRLTLIAASLLHDIGHGPLSHTLEPVFEDAFEIDHHRATRRIIKGDSIFGREIAELVSSYKLDIDEIIALIDGNHNGRYAYLFSGKINLDTLEGITRCRAIVGPRPAFGTALSIVERWAQSGTSKLPETDFDEFWGLKHTVYALLINSTLGLTMDTVAQAWIRTNLSKIEPLDFYLNEWQMRRKYPELFRLIESAAYDQSKLRGELSSKWLRVSVQARRREYYVDETVDLVSVSDIDQRYKHKKHSWTVSFAEILEKQIYREM